MTLTFMMSLVLSQALLTLYLVLPQIASSNGPPPVPETLSAATRDLALRCLEIKSENRPPAKELIHHQCFKTQPP